MATIATQGPFVSESKHRRVQRLHEFMGCDEDLQYWRSFAEDFSIKAQDRGYVTGYSDIPSLKQRASLPLKINGWKMILGSFGGKFGLFFRVFCC